MVNLIFDDTGTHPTIRSGQFVPPESASLMAGAEQHGSKKDRCKHCLILAFGVLDERSNLSLHKIQEQPVREGEMGLSQNRGP